MTIALGAILFYTGVIIGFFLAALLSANR